jgi:hypothetical protein
VIGLHALAFAVLAVTAAQLWCAARVLGGKR